MLPAKVYDELLHVVARPVRGVMRALREIIQTLLSAFKVSSQPRLIPLRKHSSLMITPSDRARATNSLR